MGWWVCWVKEPPETLMCSPQAPLRGLLHCSGPRSCGGLGAAENTSRFICGITRQQVETALGQDACFRGYYCHPREGADRGGHRTSPRQRGRGGAGRGVQGTRRSLRGQRGAQELVPNTPLLFPLSFLPYFLNNPTGILLPPLEGSTEPSAMTPCQSSSLGR